MTGIVQRVVAALMESPRRTVKQIAALTGLPTKAVSGTVHRLVREGQLRALPGPPRRGERGRPELCYSLGQCKPARAPGRPRSPGRGLAGSALMKRNALELAWAGIGMPAAAAGYTPGAQRRAA